METRKKCAFSASRRVQKKRNRYCKFVSYRRQDAFRNSVNR